MQKKEFFYKEKIADDFNNGKELLQDLKNSVTMFGSARTKIDDEFAILATKLAFNLSKKDINVITGGGDGIMGAANKGAFTAKKAESIGLNIDLPFENSANEYTTKEMTFNYFFSIIYMLVK
jgi:predicted Rossmann-fold nucleotide-binding protein